MEAIGIIGFIFGLAALGKVIRLEMKLKELEVLKKDYRWIIHLPDSESSLPLGFSEVTTMQWE